MAANFNVGSDNCEIRIQQPLTTATTLSLYIQAAGQIGDRLATLLLTVAAVDPPDFAAVLDDASPVVITGYNGLVAQVNSAGGGGGHTYTFQSGGGNFAVGADGRISLLISRPTPTTLTATLTRMTATPNTPAVTLSLTLRIVDFLFLPDRVDIRLTTYQSVPYTLHTATAENPSGGAVFYSLLSTSPPGFAGNISFTRQTASC